MMTPRIRPSRALVTPATCDCPKVVHEHGTLNMYSAHKCRCLECRAAKAEQYQRLNDVVSMVSGNETRHRLKTLIEAGFEVKQIAAVSGVSVASLHRIRANRKAVLRPKTRDAVLGIKYSDFGACKPRSGDVVVDGAIAQAQIQELHSVGWTCEDMAERSNIAMQAFYRLLRGFKTDVRSAESIDTLFREIRYVAPPEETPLQRKRVQRAKNRALANGWDGFMTEFLEAA